MSEDESQGTTSRRTNLQNLTNRNMPKLSPLEQKDIHQDLLSDEESIPEILLSTTANTTIENLYQKELEETKIRHWKQSEFAVGCVEVSWNDELSSRRNKCHEYQEKHKHDCCNCCSCSCCCQDTIEPTCGCLYLTGLVCSRYKGVKRVGNMIVLKESVRSIDDNGEEAEEKREERHLDLVVGPFWPMMLFVTYPIILSVSSWTLYSAFIKGNKPFFIFIFWIMGTLGLIVSLFQVAFRDPGIMRRYRDIPRNVPSGGSMRSKSWWKWSDAALTYRPYGALYDPDCACVIEGFDHTCPWTGTAIGDKNMAAFQSFVALVFICLIMDILLLSGLFERK